MSLTIVLQHLSFFSCIFLGIFQHSLDFENKQQQNLIKDLKFCKGNELEVHREETLTITKCLSCIFYLYIYIYKHKHTYIHKCVYTYIYIFMYTMPVDLCIECVCKCYCDNTVWIFFFSSFLL